MSGNYELRLGDQRFRARVAEGRLDLSRGSAERPDAIVETDPETLSALLWEGRRLPEARRSGDVTVEGDSRSVGRFLRLFPLPAEV